ncbi:MAG TPA: hypothetical protein VLO13_03600, partial [Halomonas sp.]|nr:hypothetical protein [Halomonas sp.]
SQSILKAIADRGERISARHLSNLIFKQMSLDLYMTMATMKTGPHTFMAVIKVIAEKAGGCFLSIRPFLVRGRRRS